MKNDKPLSDWTLGEAIAHCETTRCGECQFSNKDTFCVLQEPPQYWNLSEKSTVASDDNHGSDKPTKPRLAEVLGVEVGARFRIKGEASTYFLDKEGIMRFDSTHEKSVSGIYTAINHPESIIRAPRLTEAELKICKAVGAKWVSRDQQEPGPADENHVVLWWDKPSLSDCGVYANMSGDDTGTLPASLFPSVHPGDCICVEEAGAQCTS